MSYATVAELRAEYATAATDEFEGRHEEELVRVLTRASATIDRYRPTGVLTEAGAAQLKSVCLPIARAYAHDELALESNHPIVREYTEAMAWLMQLSKGLVPLSLQSAAGETVAAGAPVVIAPKAVFC